MKVFNLLIIFLFPIYSQALSKFSLELGVDNRFFLDDDNPKTNPTNHAFTAIPQYKYKRNNLKFMSRIQAQVGTVDSSKNFIYPEDLWLGLDTGSQFFKLGYQVLNWSSTEAFHPADVVNARNFDTNLRNAGKIGELMASYKVIFDQSSIFAFFSPYVQAPFFTEETNQYGFPITLEKPIIAKSSGNFTDDKWQPQYGLQFNTQVKGVDLSFHYLSQITREFPIVQPIVSPPLFIPEKFVPILFRTRQLGFTTQTPLGSFLLKTEFAYKFFDEDFVNNDIYKSRVNPLATNDFLKDFPQLVIGLERTFNFDNDLELTILGEIQKIFGIDDSYQLYRTTAFQSDALIGTRLTFNDVNSKELLSTLIFDYENFNQLIFQASYSQRFLESWKASLSVQVVSAIQDGDYIGIHPLRKSDHASVGITKYF